MLWTCQDCFISSDGEEIIVENRFSGYADFGLSADIFLAEGQNVRLTVEMIDAYADAYQDSALARSSVETYLEYEKNVQSAKTNMICSNDCLKGTYAGNLDVRNSNPGNGLYKLVINIHAFHADKFKITMISIGDLVLSSEIFEESKGLWFFIIFQIFGIF